MRISDWSSDVCSSDLPQSPPLKGGEARPPFPLPAREGARGWVLAALIPLAACAAPYERPSAEFAPSYAPPVTQPAQPTGAIYQPGRFARLVEDNRARRVRDVLTIAPIGRAHV